MCGARALHRIRDVAERDTTAGERRLSLRARPERGVAELDADEAQHALKVLRLAPGDTFLGLDGHGAAWRCRIADGAGRGRRAELALEVLECAGTAPAPGSAESAETRVVLHVAWPRAGPAEEMLDRLTQLGVSAIVPLVTARSGPHARELDGARRVRAQRIVREALKQCGRLWLPELGPARKLADVLAGPLAEARARLDPGAERGFLGWARAARATVRESGAREAGGRAFGREIALFVGPEGGWTDAERANLAAAGAVACRLAPHVLRIETAAEAAAAVFAALDSEPDPAH